MADTLTLPQPPRVSDDGPKGPRESTPGYGDYGSGGDAAKRLETAKLGLWVALGSMTMLFAAFTSAYIVRSAGEDWIPLQIPSLLWVNTAVILASSITVEIAHRAFLALRPMAFRRWLLGTAALGVAFLVGQLLAWSQLASQGIYLQSHPHSSFFFVLTGVHALHLVAGVLALAYVLSLAMRYKLTAGESSSPSICATYWHFVGGVWLYLFVVLFYM